MAKQAKAAVRPTSVKPTPARSARTMRMEYAAKRRRQQNLWLYGGIGFFVLLIGLVVYLNIRRGQPVAGEEIVATQGNTHIEFGNQSPIAYNTTPPTSGPHYGSRAEWRVYSEPQRYELLVHNMEDGGVLVYYQCPDGCADTVDKLTSIVDPYINAGRHVLMAPNDPTWTVGSSQPFHQDMGAKIALTAWGRILKLDDLDEAKIRAFIERYEGVDHHVAGIN